MNRLLAASIKLRGAQKDYLSDPKDQRSELKGARVGAAAEELDVAIALEKSTPAAPGIDLEQFRLLANSWIVEAAGIAAEAKHACADELLALIDASPKGGSDWEATDADIAAWVARNDLSGSFGSKTDARTAFEDARSAELATSAEGDR